MFWARGKDEIEGFAKLAAIVVKGETGFKERQALMDVLAVKVCVC